MFWGLKRWQRITMARAVLSACLEIAAIHILVVRAERNERMQIRTAKRSGAFALAVARGRLLASVVVLLGCLAGSTPVSAQCVLDTDCDDGLFCTVDNCVGGICFNNPRSCQDSTFCNGVEICDETRDLCAVACLDGGTCTNGICVGGSNPGVGCDPSISPIMCPGGKLCSENLEACVDCLSNADCGDPQLPFCDPSSGSCVACFSNAQCSNGLLCDGPESCNLTTHTCEAGTPIQCPLNPPQFCSEMFGGICVECESTLDCSGSTFCTPKTCSALKCVNATPPNCRRCVDANSNMAGACATDSDCSAGFTCTGANTFCSDVAGRCVLCLNDSDCEDLNYCTLNLCSPLDFTCQFAPDGSNICAERNGFQFCQGPEACVNSINCDPFTGAGCCLPGTPPVVDDGIPCTIDSCDEQNDVILHIPDDSSCDDSLFCDGVETCDPANAAADGNGCVAGTDVDCSFLDAVCRLAQCNETTDACVSVPDPSREGTPCVNPDNCDPVDLCQSGSCVGFPPEPDDPYRCVVLELKPRGSGPFSVGDTVGIDLIARSEGCSTSFERCLPTEQAVATVSAILTWDPVKLKLRESSPGNLNPVDACDDFDPCFQCPPNQYNWSNSFFPFDCGTSGFNEPCVASGPANDGDAFYAALDQLGNPCPDGLPPAPACVSETGLLVTTIEFEVLPAAQGQSAAIRFGDCSIEVSGARSKVNSKIPPPAPLTFDATKRLVDALISVAACSVPADCDDGDPCTSDACVGGTCGNTPLCPPHPDPCIIRTCNPATASCDEVPVACGAGEVCFDGDCFQACQSAADCDDGLACTVDTCNSVQSPGGMVLNICRNTPDDAVCDTGLFCAQQRCDEQLGCVPAHECISTTGNPCPDQASCDDVADDCGGCLTPTVAGIGPRALSVTPQDQGATSMALQVVGKCTDSNVACVSSFVQSVCVGGFNDTQLCTSDAECPKQCQGGSSAGQSCVFDSDCLGGGATCIGSCSGFVLGATPSFHPASFWGEVRITGLEIHPGTEYDVHAVCDFGGVQVASAADSGTTFLWGDVNDDKFVNVTDIVGVVDVVKKLPTASVSFEAANIWPCQVDRVVNVTDLTAVVDAVKGTSYPCASTCP